MKVPAEIRKGRPKRRYLDNIRKDLSERELSGEHATGTRVVASSNPTKTAWKLWQFSLSHFAPHRG